MTAFLLKSFDGHGFFTIGGFRETMLSITPEKGFTPVSFNWRELLREDHADKVRIDARGLFTSRSAEQSFRRTVIEGEIADFELSYEDGLRFQCPFRACFLQPAGEFSGEQLFDITLHSQGKAVIISG